MDVNTTISHGSLVSPCMYHPTLLDLQHQHHIMAQAFSMPPTLRSQPVTTTTNSTNSTSTAGQSTPHASTTSTSTSTTSSNTAAITSTSTSTSTPGRPRRALSEASTNLQLSTSSIKPEQTSPTLLLKGNKLYSSSSSSSSGDDDICKPPTTTTYYHHPSPPISSHLPTQPQEPQLEKKIGGGGTKTAQQKLEARRGARSGKHAPLPNVHKHDSLKDLVTLELVPYWNYRSRQKNSNGESVWDEETEQAFMEALQKIPRIGRHKLSIPHLQGKPCGRNELISDYIYRRTGQKRSRKQVSSHIQVLKNLLKLHQGFMRLVTPPDPTNPFEAESTADYMMGSPALSEAMPTPILSTQQTVAPPPPPPTTYLPRPSTSTLGVFASPPLSAHTAQFPVYTEGIRPSAFMMWVGTLNDSGSVDDCFHTYTALAPSGAQRPTGELAAMPRWQARFPHVADIAHELADSRTQTLHLSASMATLATATPENSLLCTVLQIDVPRHCYRDTADGDDENDDEAWRCVSRIYARGKKVWELSHAVPAVTECDGSSTKLTLPFASDFWSAFYTALSAAGERGHDSSSDEEEEVGRRQQRQADGEKGARQAIGGITVVQEVWRTGIMDERRAAVLLWDFTKAYAGHCGTATWRELIPPAAPPPQQQQQHLPMMVTAHEGLRIDTNAGAAAAAADWTQQLPITPFDDLSPAGMGSSSYFPFDELNVAFDSTNAASAQILDSMNVPFYTQPAVTAADFHNQFAAVSAPMGDSTGVQQYLASSCTEGWPHNFSPVSPVDELDVKF